MTSTFPRSYTPSNSRLPSPYHSAPPTIGSQHTQHSRSFMTDPIRDPSIIYSGDRSSFNVRRSTTRNSHYSQPTSHYSQPPSVTASTRSWVHSTQQNPPPPPDEVLTPISSPFRGSRPLPDPQYYTLPHHPQHTQIPVYHTTNGYTSPADEDEDEYMNIDAHAPGMALGYLAEGLGRGRVPADTLNSPRTNTSSAGRSFVGGFVSTLRKLPRVVLRHKTGKDEKRKYSRHEFMGTEDENTEDTGGQLTATTLPRYDSIPRAPVAGPSNFQEYPARVPVPINLDDIPTAHLGPSISQRRRRPGFRVSPPSDVTEQDETVSHNPTPAPVARNPNVSVYNLPQSGEEYDYPGGTPGPGTVITGTETHSIIPPSVHTATPNRHTLTDPHPSSHQQLSSTHTSTPAVVASPPPHSPVLAHPLPTADYRKMTISSTISPRSYPCSSISDEPSFSSQLNPIRRFFRALYHLPWIAQERVTVDYRPEGRGRTVVRKGSKKDNPSWYRGSPGAVRSGSEKMDLLSSAGGSKRASDNSASTHGHTILRHRSSDRLHGGTRRHHHRHHKDNHHGHHGHHHHHGHHSRRNHRRRRTFLSSSTSTTEPQTQPAQPPANTSPIIPSVYPYPYFPYAFPAFQSASPLAIQGSASLQPIHRTQSSTPRGPRPAPPPAAAAIPAGPVYPHGYTPYQAPPPTYLISQAPPPSQGPLGEGGIPNGDTLAPAVGHPMPVPFYILPGAMPPTPPPVMATASGHGHSPSPGPVNTVPLTEGAS